MKRFVLAFLAGVLLLFSLHTLPDRSVVAVGSFCVLLSCLFFRERRILPGLLAGFLCALVTANQLGAWEWPVLLEGSRVQVTGRVVSVPEQSPWGTRFVFALLPSLARVSLVWREAPVLHPGETWQLSVRLKRMHGLMNPGGVDHETLAFPEGIRARGHVLDGPGSVDNSFETKCQQTLGNRLLKGAGWHALTDRLRQWLLLRIRQVVPASPTACWVPALSVGIRENIPAREWEILRQTGTNHLMAIAGLHLGFVSAWLFFLADRVWRRFPQLCLRLPAHQAGALTACLGAVCYAALSGFALPARRACLMVFAGMLPLLMRRMIPVWQTVCFALLFVLLAQPQSVLTGTFWLSFGSVVLIVLGLGGRIRPGGLWWHHGRIQWITALGLMPLGVWLFQQYSLVSFVANAIAIPWMGCLILPCVFVGTLLLPFSLQAGGLLLRLADTSLGGMWHLLSFLSHLPFSAIPAVAGAASLLLALAGVVWCLMPAGFPGRPAGLLLCLPLFFPAVALPGRGEAWFSLLDVGQGLSAVVRTRQHVLVFDAGTGRGQEFDAGENVVTPFLRQAGVKQIDVLVASHADSDHAGGIPGLLRHFPVKKILSSAPARMPAKASFCQSGQHWIWEGVQFAFLYPDRMDLQSGNDSSCVLKITAAGGESVLLTGDIEKNAEKKLLARGEDLRASLLVVPHHGSKTSGEPAFIAAVHPVWALFPVGYRNRYHFPHPVVMQRYLQAGVQPLQTQETGAIRFVLGSGRLQPECWRKSHGHFWHAQGEGQPC